MAAALATLALLERAQPADAQPPSAPASPDSEPAQQASARAAAPAAVADAVAAPPVLSPALAAGLWTLAQLVPSPLLVAGSAGLGGGLRWQVTPLLYSFGVAARPLRAFVIEPVARHSGALELYVSPEWGCCAPHGASSWIGRAGARVYLPLSLSGEALAGSLGGSAYLADGRHGAALELGLYTLSSVVGVTVTLSPALEGRELISALSLHFY